MFYLLLLEIRVHALASIELYSYFRIKVQGCAFRIRKFAIAVICTYIDRIDIDHEYYLCNCKQLELELDVDASTAAHAASAVHVFLYIQQIYSYIHVYI